MKKTICIHQVEHLIWLGLIDTFSKADWVVFADDFQFKKNYFENRNRIRTKNGEKWVTIPIEKDNHKPMLNIHITEDPNWRKKYLKTIKCNYEKAPYFDIYYPEIVKVINQEYILLMEFNYDLINLFKKWFKIKSFFYCSSYLKIDPNLRGTERLLEICKKMGATTYLSGPSGKDYLNLELFKQAGIEVEFHEFEHPIYKQQFEPFIPNLSAIDYLFNEGHA